MLLLTLAVTQAISIAMLYVLLKGQSKQQKEAESSMDTHVSHHTEFIQITKQIREEFIFLIVAQ